MNKLTLQDPVPGAGLETAAVQKPPLPKPVQGPPAPAGTPRAAAPGQNQDRNQGQHQDQNRDRGTAAQARPAGAGQPAGKTEPDTGINADSLPASGLESDLESGLESGLAAADLDRIAARLRGGESPLAARGDLVELHSRITRMFATLNEGLGEMHARKAAADREILSSRIDTLEAAVNRMEGALRIEFEPLLKSALAEALAQQAPPRRSQLRRGLGLTLLAALALALGLGLGSRYHQPLQSGLEQLGAELAGSAAQP